MHFDFDLLTRVRRAPGGTAWVATCISTSTTAEGPTEEHALEAIHEQLRVFVETEATALINAYAGNEDECWCPNATINLLADRWFCKETDRDCPLGGVISRYDLDTSLRRCTAPDRAKQTVRGAMAAGYAGHHHQAGTYACSGCRRRIRRRFKTRGLRYRFELQNLCDVLDLPDEGAVTALRVQMIERNVKLSLSSYHCAGCLHDAVSLIAPDVALELRVLHFDVSV